MSWASHVATGSSSQANPVPTTTTPVTTTSKTGPAAGTSTSAQSQPISAVDVALRLNEQPWLGEVDSYNIPMLWNFMRTECPHDVTQFEAFCRQNNMLSDQSIMGQLSKSTYDDTREYLMCNDDTTDLRYTSYITYIQHITHGLGVADFIKWAHKMDHATVKRVDTAVHNISRRMQNYM